MGELGYLSQSFSSLDFCKPSKNKYANNAIIKPVNVMLKSPLYTTDYKGFTNISQQLYTGEQNE